MFSRELVRSKLLLLLFAFLMNFNLLDLTDYKYLSAHVLIYQNSNKLTGDVIDDLAIKIMK